MSRRWLAVGALAGCALAGPTGCAAKRPATTPSPAAAARSRHGTAGPRRERPTARASEAAVSGSGAASSVDSGPPPEEEARLEARYGSTRPLSVLDGEASYYGDSLAGHHTANGERYDPRAFTAAHRTLPFGTILRVVRADTGAVVYVRVTDRGPFGHVRRILDLSRAAAERLHMIRAGVAKIRAEIVAYGPRQARPRRRR